MVAVFQGPPEHPCPFTATPGSPSRGRTLEPRKTGFTGGRLPASLGTPWVFVRLQKPKKAETPGTTGNLFADSAGRKWVVRRRKIGWGIGELARYLNERSEPGNVRQILPGLVVEVVRVD